MLEELEESGEMVLDSTIQDKLYKRWQKQLEKRMSDVSDLNDDDHYLEMVEI